MPCRPGSLVTPPGVLPRVWGDPKVSCPSVASAFLPHPSLMFLGVHPNRAPLELSGAKSLPGPCFGGPD